MTAFQSYLTGIEILRAAVCSARVVGSNRTLLELKFTTYIAGKGHLAGSNRTLLELKY